MLEEPIKGLLEKKVKDHINPSKTTTCIMSLHLLEFDLNDRNVTCFGLGLNTFGLHLGLGILLLGSYLLDILKTA